MEAGGGCFNIATDIGDFLFVGGIYVDMVTEVSEFPEEDTACRAKGMWRSRGGNAANSAVVLAQLGNRVHWMGATPGGDDPDTAFVLACMHNAVRFGVHA